MKHQCKKQSMIKPIFMMIAFISTVLYLGYKYISKKQLTSWKSELNKLLATFNNIVIPSDTESDKNMFNKIHNFTDDENVQNKDSENRYAAFSASHIIHEDTINHDHFEGIDHIHVTNGAAIAFDNTASASSMMKD